MIPSLLHCPATAESPASLQSCRDLLCGRSLPIFARVSIGARRECRSSTRMATERRRPWATATKRRSLYALRSPRPLPHVHLDSLPQTYCVSLPASITGVGHDPVAPSWYSFLSPAWFAIVLRAIAPLRSPRERQRARRRHNLGRRCSACSWQPNDRCRARPRRSPGLSHQGFQPLFVTLIPWR